MRSPQAIWSHFVAVTICALLICSTAAVGAAESVASKVRDPLQVREGERQTVAIPNAVAVAVQDTAIARARVAGAAEISVTGVAVGETWVEISYGTRQWIAIRVAVIPRGLAGANLRESEVEKPPPAARSSSESKATAHAEAEADAGESTPFSLAVTPPSPKFRVAVATRYGYDKSDAVQRDAGVLLVQRRHIFIGETTLEFQLRETTSLEFTVPYVGQTARLSSPLGSVSARGHGLGDLTLLLEQRWPEVLPGSEFALAVGTLIPTGKDAFEVGDNELPTGVGFYQPFGRITLSKSLAPLRVFAIAEYARSLSRSIEGRRLRLDDSYAFEVGFLYNISPEFISQTSVSLAQVSSPFIAGENSVVDVSRVGYLRQSLIYRTGGYTTLQGAVMLGLTEDSIDAFVSLELTQEF